MVHIKLPKVWFGFVICAAFLIVGVIELDEASTLYGWRASFWISISAIVYWLYCVYGMNRAVRDASDGKHPIIPSQSVTFHFIPIFNLYWIFRWTNAIGEFLRDNSQTYLRGEGGCYILVCFVISKEWDPFLGMISFFIFGLYFNRKIKKAIKVVSSKVHQGQLSQDSMGATDQNSQPDSN